MTTFTTGSQQNSRKSAVQLMSQSTIYQMHEARRMKTLLQKDDPRSAPIRVLSNLPGFRLFFPPYQPPIPSSISNAASHEAAGKDFPEANVFTLYEVENKIDSPIGRAYNPSFINVCASASIGAAISEALLFRPHTSLSRINGGVLTMNSQILPVFHDGATMALMTRRVVKPTYDTGSPLISPSLYAQIAGRAISASMLFGTKSVLERAFGDATDDVISLPKVLAAGSSGAVLAFYRSVCGLSAAYWRESLGAALYFSTYDLVKSSLMSSNANDATTYHDMGAIMVAGGMAGVLYDAIRSTGSVYGRLGFTMIGARGVSLATLTLRSAPAHSVLFLGYEMALATLTPKQTAVHDQNFPSRNRR